MNPGMKTERSGVYRVYHYAHRMPHEVYIGAGVVLPSCKHCGDRVQFAPLIASGLLETDTDFCEGMEASA